MKKISVTKIKQVIRVSPRDQVEAYGEEGLIPALTGSYREVKDLIREQTDEETLFILASYFIYPHLLTQCHVSKEEWFHQC